MQKFDYFQPYPELYHPWWNSWWVYGFLGLCIIFILIVIGYLIYRRWVAYYYRFDKVYIRFLEDVLKRSDMNDSAIRACYVDMIKRLKIYFQKRYHVDLFDKQDKDMLDFLHGNLDVNVVPLIQDFLDRAFYVKFARNSVSLAQLHADSAMLIKMVLQTQQQ